MKRRVAKLLSIALIGTMVVGMTACGEPKDDGDNGDSVSTDQGEAKESSDISVGIVVKTATNAHFQDIAYGAVLAGKDLGIEVRVDNTATESDVEGQITKCENMISAGVNALILTPNDSDGVTNAVNAAHDAGIPFVTVDTTINPDPWGDDVAEYMPNYIGVDHTEMAYNLAKNVFDKMGGEGKVIILRGTDAASSSQERTAGFERAAEEYDGIEVIENQSGEYDQDTAAGIMGDFIAKYGDGIDAVLCCNDLMAMGAVSEFKNAGIAVGEDGVLIAGIDGNYIALQSIEAGEVYATAYDWSILQGYYAVEQAYALINGEEVPETTSTPDTIITSENIDEYLPHGEEVDNWGMGDPIDTVSDYMRSFLELGEGLMEE